MKKTVSSLVPIALVALLAFPVAVQAKGVEDSPKVKSHVKETNSQNAQMNAQWSRFLITGVDEEGKLKDTNPIFDYKLAEGTYSDLVDGDTVKLNVINRGGNIVKTINYSKDGLEVVDDDEDVDETESIDPVDTDEKLDDTYGAVRLLNFNNGTGSEGYLANSQENLNKSGERTLINFSKDDGVWENRNKVRFGYDYDEEKVWVELDVDREYPLEYEYREEYETGDYEDLDAIQFVILNDDSDSDVRIQNIKLNGEAISNITLIGDTDERSMWNLEGDIQDSHGDFVVEADLVITGDQEDNESIVEIMFGEK